MSQYIECEKDIECEKYLMSRTSIVNHSKNIIDLIEVGDHVNGSRVIGLEGNGIYDKLVNVEERNHYNILPDDIRRIVTKEQFASVEYVF